MDFLKHIEDLSKGIFDSIVTAPYALSDFIARGILEFLSKILEFPRINLNFQRLLRFARNDENSRIP